MNTPHKQLIIPQRKKRTFLPEDFQVTQWKYIQPFYNQLLEREITSVETFKKWFEDVSELASVVSEDAGWRYIHIHVIQPMKATEKIIRRMSKKFYHSWYL